MMNDRSAGPIVGETPGPNKVKKKWIKLRMQDPSPAKVEVKKSKQQAPTSPTAIAGPQSCKVEPNNNK
jgi:hypothetical protein